MRHPLLEELLSKPYNRKDGKNNIKAANPDKQRGFRRAGSERWREQLSIDDQSQRCIDSHRNPAKKCRPHQKKNRRQAFVHIGQVGPEDDPTHGDDPIPLTQRLLLRPGIVGMQDIRACPGHTVDKRQLGAEQAGYPHQKKKGFSQRPSHAA